MLLPTLPLLLFELTLSSGEDMTSLKKLPSDERDPSLPSCTLSVSNVMSAGGRLFFDSRRMVPSSATSEGC